MKLVTLLLSAALGAAVAQTSVRAGLADASRQGHHHHQRRGPERHFHARARRGAAPEGGASR